MNNEDTVASRDYRQECIAKFDASYYESRYKDVRKNRLDPLRHYLEYGFYEGREPCFNFKLPNVSFRSDNEMSNLTFPLSLYIPTFNNPTYLLNIVGQTRNFDWLRLIIYDNNSKTKKMLKTLNELEVEGFEIVRRKDNLGPESIYLNHGALEKLPDFFLLSDPDLNLNNFLTIENIKILALVSECFQIGKVGCALKIELNKITKKILKHGDSRFSTYDWEKQFWINKLGFLDNGDTIYSAAVGATFCIVNKKYLDLDKHWSRGARIGGSFTITHLPWEPTLQVPAYERWTYRRLQKHSFYTLPTGKKRLINFFSAKKNYIFCIGRSLGSQQNKHKRK